MSRYENQFDDRRSTNEETSNEEFKIAVNGLNLIVNLLLGKPWTHIGGESPKMGLESGTSTKHQ